MKGVFAFLLGVLTILLTTAAADETIAAKDSFVEFRICPKERLFADDTFYPYTVTTGRKIPFRAWTIRDTGKRDKRGNPILRRENYAPEKIVWSCDAPKVATVSPEGVVITESPGKADVIGKDAKGRTHTVELNVVNPQNASIDLCIAFVERYVRGDDGGEYKLSRYFGRLTDNSGGMLKPSDDLPEQNYPHDGQIVIWRAHIFNDGQRDSGPVTVVWKVDGKEAKRERIDNLPPGGPLVHKGRFVDAAKKFPLISHQNEITTHFELKNEVRKDQPWRPQRRQVSIELIGPDDISEDNADNNKLSLATDAIVFGYYYSESQYLGFCAVNRHPMPFDEKNGMVKAIRKSEWKEEVDIRATTAYDRIQRINRVMNKEFANSRHPLLPNGISERTRAEVWIVPDVDDYNSSAGFNLTNFGRLNKDIDIVWGHVQQKDQDVNYFTREMMKIKYARMSYHWIDLPMVHEMCHGRYLNDYYTTPVQHRIVHVLDDDGKRIYPDDREHCYDNNRRFNRHGARRAMMNGNYINGWCEHAAYAMERIAGRRARYSCWNGGWHHDYSEYHGDVADKHTVVVLDPDGKPLRNVKVELIRRSGGDDEIRGDHYKNRVDYTAVTDKDGKAPLPANPLKNPHTYPDDWQSKIKSMYHPKGLWGPQIALIRLRYKGRSFYKWLTGYDVNFAYWYKYGFEIDQWPYPNLDEKARLAHPWHGIQKQRDTSSVYYYTIDPDCTPEEELAAREEVPRLGTYPDVREGEYAGPE